MHLAQPQATGAACFAGRVFLGLALRGRNTGQLLRTQIGSRCRPMGAVSL